MKIKAPHSLSLEEIARQLEVDPQTGLSQGEAERRLEQYGPNQLEEHRQTSLLRLLVQQFSTPVVYLLAAAAALSFAFNDLAEGIFILIIILVNAAIGFGMEFQARKSMEALREMDLPQARVLRGGQEKTIEAIHLVPGDVLLLETGDLLPADGRLLEVKDLKINESALTGESVAVEKNTDVLEENLPLGDRHNLVFKGSAIDKGRGKALVTATGMDTELGNISRLVKDTDKEEVPLDRKLNRLTHVLIWAVLAMAAILGLVGLVTGRDLYLIVQTSIAWAIAAIPEGLPIVASIALARGMLRLARHQVVVKRLAAVETLGETNIIFTDKTGTLTENRLSVDTISCLAGEWRPEAEEPPAEAASAGRHFLQIALWCNDAAFDPAERDEQHGDPLEIALLEYAFATDEEKARQLRTVERRAEVPFDSDSKMMATAQLVDGRLYIATKGAAGAILGKSTQLLDGEQTREFREEDRQFWLDKNRRLSEQGLRTLGFGYREMPGESELEEKGWQEQLTFIGLIGFLDPPRSDVRQAIETCRKAGIAVVMVTGDHPGTARTIGRQVRLLDPEEEDRELNSRQIEEADEETITRTLIFSRVSPEEKLRIIETYQEKGHTVGMTGDGVNDAPALKRADIGIAMGERGTQVARDSADMVLKDDAFPSIVEAIREGRIIFANIRKFIIYQLSYHLGEVLLIAAAAFTLAELPLLPLQLLFLNLLTDVFPALALGIGPGRKEVMKQAPKEPEEPILNRSNWYAIAVYGAVIALFTTGAYLWARMVWEMPAEQANDVVFFALPFAQLLHLFNMRDPGEPIFHNQITQNRYVWMAIAFCILVLLATYFIPYLRDLLSLETLPAQAWILVLVSSLLSLVTIQLLKGWLPLEKAPQAADQN